MRRLVTSFFLVLLSMTAVAVAKAETFTASSSGVDYSINSGGNDYVSPSSLFGSNATAASLGGNFALAASNPGYSDAGIVLYFNGGLTLGQLQGVNVTSVGNPLSVNLWFDTGGDGNFFTFSGTQLTGLGGDSYGGNSDGAVDASSSFYMFGGDGAGHAFTLAQLIAGDDSGIDANTPTALWIGLTNPSSGTANSAKISQIYVDTASSVTPEPSSLALLGTGLLGLVGVFRRRLA